METIDNTVVNKGMEVINKATDKISENQPSANILYFAIVIIIIVILIFFFERSEFINYAMLIFGFALLVLIAYIFLNIFSQRINLMKQSEFRDKHNQIYQTNVE
jgi:hypothetical protein